MSDPTLVDLTSTFFVLCTNIRVYQLPLILTALLHVDLINVVYLTAFAFIRS